MTRNQALAAIKAAGAQGDMRAFTRLYVENRISLPVARQAYREGVRLGEFIAKRNAIHDRLRDEIHNQGDC